MSNEFPTFVRYKEVTSLDGTESIYLDASDSDVPKRISYDNFIIDIGNDISIGGGDIVFVSSKNDLPTPVSSVITLEDNVTYYFTTTVDLLGDRLVGGENTVILGSSSENSRIKSTGLGVGIALFTTEWTTPIRHVTFQDVDTALAIDGSINPPLALDWTGVNFLNVPNIGLIDTADNFIFSKGAFLNSQGIVFDGTIGTVGIDNSIFVGSGSAGNIIELPSSFTVNRRFRMIYSSMVVFDSTVGINASVNSTIPAQGLILDTVNFSGGGTYVSGYDYLDNETLFINTIGIQNSREISQYYMNGNTTVTTIASGGDTQKVQGTTTSSPFTAKFTNTNNRATYTGAITRTFHTIANLSLSSGTNDVIGSYVAKNGTIIAESEIYTQTDTNGDLSNVTIQALTELQTDDYIEIYVENSSDGSDITVTDLNVTIQ